MLSCCADGRGCFRSMLNDVLFMVGTGKRVTKRKHLDYRSFVLVSNDGGRRL